MKSSKHRLRRHAITLTELLVVVAIIVILASILLPMVQPILRGQKVREASRQVSVFITAAQGRAVATGRPAGIWIERAGHEPTDTTDGDPRWYTSYRVFPTEQPEPYRGDMLDARVVIRPQGTGTLWGAFYDDDPSNPRMLDCCGSVFPRLQSGIPIVRPGDLIRFDGRGDYYMIVGVDQFKFTFQAPLMLVNGTPSPDPDLVTLFQRSAVSDPDQMPSYQPGVAFEVLRRPVKSTAAPLEMPRGTGIDLSVSGYGPPFQTPMANFGIYTADRVATVDPTLAGPARFREISPEYDIVIMFSPDGGVDRVYFVSREVPVYANMLAVQDTDLIPFWEVPYGDISLMVARDEQIGRAVDGSLAISDNFTANALGTLLGVSTLSDTDNYWISFTADSGRVISATTANAFTDPLLGTPLPTTLTLTQYLTNARRFVKSGRSTGGR